MEIKTYDYLVVGAGLYGSTFAHLAKQQNKSVLVIDRRSQLGGNLFCENIEGINIHKYGAHIFHTSNVEVWNFVNSFVPFNQYKHSPLAIYKDKVYNLPFNMNTFYALWGTKTPKEAKDMIELQKLEFGIKEPKNLEERAISLVGKDIYKILIKGYTEKQWGRKAVDMPSFIINRLPVRFTYDNSYFNDAYQGIPIGGYNLLIDGLLKGIDTKLNVDYLKDKSSFDALAHKVLYTGPIDEYYAYRFGKLEYRSLFFEEEILNTSNYQGCAVMNYAEKEIPFTRIIEHKHFEYGTQDKTVITREYPTEWTENTEPYYPINNEKNNMLYKKYESLQNENPQVMFGGRLAEYKYMDMHVIIENVLNKYRVL